tara:strand:+ start:8471 stop:11545 length:3075 start_codon:yes stop_codon:yes gene_type:complete
MAINVKNYIIEKIKNQDPEIDVRPGSSIYDFLINPLSSILEPYQSEHKAIIDRQAVTDISTLSTSELDAVAANYLVERNSGNKAQGYVRMYFRSARSLSLPAGTKFTDATGNLEFETAAPFEVTKFQMSRNVSDFPNFDTGDIFVQAIGSGSEYNVQANVISKIKTSAVSPLKVANPNSFSLGEDSETNSALFARLKDSVYNSSLSSAEGIEASIKAQKSSVVDVEVVGAGHDLMIRDLTTLSEDVENYQVEDFYLVHSGTRLEYYKQHRAYTGVFLDIDETADVAIPKPNQFTKEFSDAMYQGIFFQNDEFYYAQDDQQVIIREYFQDYADPNIQVELGTVLSSGLWQVHDGSNPTQELWHLDEVKVINNRLRLGSYIDPTTPAEDQAFQSNLSQLQQIYDLLGSVLMGTTEEAYAQLGNLISPTNFNNLSPVFHKIVDQHLGVQLDIRMSTTDTSDEGEMAYVTFMRNKDYYAPHDGYGFAWRKQPQAWINIAKGQEFTSEADELMFFEHTGLNASDYYGTLGDVSNKALWKYTVFLVDNDLLSQDFWVGSSQLADQTNGKNQFLQAQKVWIEPNVDYEFRMKIYPKMATDVWVYPTANPPIGSDGTAYSPELKVINRGQTYPTYIPQAAGTHFGVGVGNTRNSVWHVDNIECTSFDETFPMHLFRFKLPVDKFPPTGGMRVKYYGVGWDPVRYAADGNSGHSKNKVALYNTTTGLWETLGTSTGTIDNPRYLQEVKASKQGLANYIDSEGFTNVAATAANSGPDFPNDIEHSLRSYYCSIDNIVTQGVHRGNAVDIYVHDPVSIVEGNCTFTASSPTVYTRNIPGIASYIQRITSIRDSITDEEIDASLYTITLVKKGDSFSKYANFSIQFDIPDITGAELKIYYKYWAYGDALHSYMMSSSKRFPAADMLVKVMPPAVVTIDKLQYSGGITSDEMRLKLVEYLVNLTDTSFEKSDFVNVLYDNGATYVDLDMDISIERYSTTYEPFTTVMSDTTQRYTIPDTTVARFFCDVTDLAGVERI